MSQKMPVLHNFKTVQISSAKKIWSTHSSKLLSLLSQSKYSLMSTASPRSKCNTVKLYARALAQSRLDDSGMAALKLSFSLRPQYCSYTILFDQTRAKRATTLPYASAAFPLSHRPHFYFSWFTSNFWEHSRLIYYDSIIATYCLCWVFKS